VSCGGNCGCGKKRDADSAFDLLNRLKSDAGNVALPDPPKVYFAGKPHGTHGVSAPWWMRFFRITRIRVVSQFFFFAIFAFFCFTTWFSRLKGYPVSLILEIDPLVAVATAISTHTVYRHLIWSLWLIVPTLLLGRFFCNWMCPYGTLHQFFGWLFNTRRNIDKLAINRYRSIFQLKYIILIIFIVLAVFGSLQIGLLDPICLMYRTMTTTVEPAMDLATDHAAQALEAKGISSGWIRPLAHAPGAPHQRIFYGAWFIGAMIMVLVGMNLVIPRFFCRVLCPLGAFLGWMSRFSLWRIDRDVTRCTDCNLCLAHCEGASDPQAALRKSECFVCFNCIDDCPEDALSFRFMPVSKHKPVPSRHVISKLPDTEVTWPDLSRRRWILAGFAGLIGYPFLRLSAAVNGRAFDKKVIRPPGSVEESEFLERCIKCDQCINVCPTNVLQPAKLGHAGFEGFWTPVMDMRIGFCQLNCTLCSEVCPTGAIQKISIEKKLGLAQFAAEGPIRLGTAFFNQGRCLPWAMETPCVVCEEVCPVSPKAIGTYDVQIKRWDGTMVTLNRPYMRPELCIGCGICEHECPVIDDPAVYVTAVGESRSKDRSLLLRSKQT
jgi:polyferredoxin/formate hydrogenlyase subunit 6/NADH:ubiquinone oxidoreductase subunit I